MQPDTRVRIKSTGEIGYVVKEDDDGTFSPTLKHGIALALISKEIAVGTQLTIDVRGRDSVCEVVTVPFVPSHVR